MPGERFGIDHAVIAVRDLERARETWRRLGFTLTPRGVHTLGSQNHCIVFERDYVELLAVPRPHPALEYYAGFLAQGEGLAAIALATDDAVGAHAGLRAAGIAADPPLDFSRPVEFAGGARDAAFRIVQLPVAATPGCRVFLCQHFTPELVWRPEYREHANGATGIAALALIAEDCAGTAARYARIFGTRPRPIPEGRLVETASAPIAIASRARLGRRLDGVGLPVRARPLVGALFVRVADRARTARVLQRGGFEPVLLADGSLALHAAQANGVTLVFG
jgi:catechol 2,3-dioxygenase-like lactoylglutathione lyase family enzyme